MGLNTARREIQFVVCPDTGGNTITPPTGPLVFTVSKDAIGTDAIVSFPVWEISDIVTGCGEFERYEISATYEN
jgi:hypothetical protein